MPGFCRDCLSELPDAAGSGTAAAGMPMAGLRRCGHCGSPRLLVHPELYRLGIAHIDCDAFYAAVEKRDRPDLRDRPVIIGGGRRGVVSTACYVARLQGVRSAMPMFKALALCPDAVVLRPDMEKYSAVSRLVRDRFEALTPMVEPLSLDEAFLDLNGTERLHGAPPARQLADLCLSIENEIGITVSVGLSYNKFLAKLASEIDKPRGFAVIGRAEAQAFLADRPVGDIWGVGAKLQARLRADGITRIGQLAGRDEARMVKRYGSIAQRLVRFARGQDDRNVQPDRERKSISAETTFDTDIAAFEVLDARLWRLSERVAEACRRKQVSGRTIVLKLKTADFQNLTRSHTLPAATGLAHAIHEAGRAMLTPLCDGRSYRLIGIGVANLQDGDTPAEVDLLSPLDGAANAGRARLEDAMSSLRERFGRDAVDRGLALGDPRKVPRPKDGGG